MGVRERLAGWVESWVSHGLAADAVLTPETQDAIAPRLNAAMVVGIVISPGDILVSAAVGVITSTGLTFTREVAVATESPRADARYLSTFTLLGIDGIRREKEQTIDHESLDRVLRAEWEGDAKENAESMTADFRAYLEENRDEIEALTIFFSQPHRRSEPSSADNSVH